jgi:hypothetical protein
MLFESKLLCSLRKLQVQAPKVRPDNLLIIGVSRWLALAFTILYKSGR